MLCLRLEGFDGGECRLFELRLGRGDILAERLVDGGANLVERGAQGRGLRLGLQDGVAGGEREMLLEGFGVLRQRVDLLLRLRVEGFDGCGGGRLELLLGRHDIAGQRAVDGAADLVERGAQGCGLRLGLQEGLAGGEREMLLEGVGVLRQRVDLFLRFRMEGLDGCGGGRLELRLRRHDIAAQRAVNGAADLVERGAQGRGLRLGLQD